MKSIVLPADLPHRLLLAARNGLPYLGPEVRGQIESLLTLENFAFLAAFIAADLAFSGTGFGLVLNVVAGGLTVIFVGTQTIEGARHFHNFYNMAAKARTPSEFQRAGHEFARAVRQLGVAALAVWFARRMGTRSRGQPKAAINTGDAEASWRALADSIKFEIPQDKGVIYAGISDAEALARSANIGGEVINQTARDYGWTAENMDRDFGKNSAVTYRLWEYLSLKYQQSLKGRVTAYIDWDRLRFDKEILAAGRGAGSEVERTGGKGPSVILTELEELMTSNKNVTSILVRDIKSGKSWTYTPRMKSSLSH